MNTHNNSRAKNTKEKILNALIYLLQRKPYNQIFVKDICKIACINRSSFYAHYYDINDLMTKTEQRFSNEINEIFKELPFSHEKFVKMFEYIKEHKEFYLAYLKDTESNFMEKTDFLGYNEKFKNSVYAKNNFTESEFIYHLTFFSAGIKAICKVWLLTDTKEPPEQMARLLIKEYSRNNDIEKFNKK